MAYAIPLVRKLAQLEATLPATDVRYNAMEVVIDEHGDNPIISETLSGKSDAPQQYVSRVSRTWKGWRNLVPHRRNRAYNAEVENAEEIFPDARQMRTRGIFMFDNPISGFVDGAALGYGLSRLFNEVVYPALGMGEVEPEFEKFVAYSGAIVLTFALTAVGSLIARERHSSIRKTKKEARWLSGILSRYRSNKTS